MWTSIQRLPGVPGYAALAARAVHVEPFGVPVKVASRTDLLAMKRAAARPIDLADIAELETGIG